MKINVYHVHGLSFAEGSECTVELLDNGVKVANGDNREVIPFRNIATFEFDGCDIVEESGVVGLISCMAGGLVGRLEGAKFLEWVAPKDAKYPEEVTCLILNYVTSDAEIRRCVFVENPAVDGEDSVINMVFKYNEVRPNCMEENLNKYGEEIFPQDKK